MVADGAEREPRFTWDDIDGWVAQGLMAPEQARAIRRFVENGELAPALPHRGARSPGSGREQEESHGFNLITIAYYFGGLLILLAYTFFVGLAWEDLGAGSQAAIALGTIGGLWAIGGGLRRAGYDIGGGLLVFAGTGIVPLGVYTLLKLFGLWPDDSNTDAYREFYQEIAPAWVTLELISILVTLAVLWRVRFPLLTLPLAFWTWFLSMDLSRWIARSEDRDWGNREQAVGLAVGLLTLALGGFLQRRYGLSWSRWFYLFGHLAVIVDASALALDEDAGGLRLLYPLLFLAFVVLSVRLQERTFLVFGALGCYAYASYLAFEVFDGALGFVFALAAIGLTVVLSAVAYQRFVRQALEEWLGRRRPPAASLGSRP
ncbi:MAG: hypothetical protein M3Q71_09310 [Chloroflexota bacterium]|nr:hypothetical protein [Chloroflexota bacterium]